MRGRLVSALELQLKGYRLTTAEIIYHLPDHPSLLQSFIWQKFDLAPDFPVLSKFLEFWKGNIEGRLHSVNIKQSSRTAPNRFRLAIQSSPPMARLVRPRRQRCASIRPARQDRVELRAMMPASGVPAFQVRVSNRAQYYVYRPSCYNLELDRVVATEAVDGRARRASFDGLQ